MTAEPIRGLYWSARSYQGPSRRSIRSTPAEMFAANLLVLNHLLSARRVTPADVADISHPTFRHLVTEIGERLFTPGSGCALYHSPLPLAACREIREYLPSRRHPLTGEARPFRDHIRHEVHIAPAWVYHTDETLGDERLLGRIHRLTALQLCDGAILSALLPRGAQLATDVARLLTERALIPCDATNLRVCADADPHRPRQYTYGELMGGVQPPTPPGRRPLITAESPLYWVDLLQLSFKHGSIVNEGDINRDRGTGYTITDNVLRVHADRAFFVHLMQSARGDENQIFILPLTCFLMDGRLYAHDHKRAAASLLGGERYLLGVVHQDGELVLRREVGYHPTKGLFSRQDRSMLLYLTEPQMDAWGHWFFRVGGEDPTGLLRWVDTRAGDWRTAAVSDDPALARLHEQVRPGILTSLDDADRLHTRGEALVQDGLRMIHHLQGLVAGGAPRGQLRKLLIGGYIVRDAEADALLSAPDALLERLGRYEAALDTQRRTLHTLSDRDALLRWELSQIGDPVTPILRRPWFLPELREAVLQHLPVFTEFLSGEQG